MIPLSVSLPWIAEMLLELSGAFMAIPYRKQIPALFWMLYFAAASDVLTMATYAPKNMAWRWMGWANEFGMWLFLLVLGCQACGKLMGERKGVSYAAALICGLAGLVNWLAWSNGDALKDKLLNGAAAADAMLITLLFLAWIARRTEIDAQWKAITLGVFVRLVWDFGCTLAWGKGAQGWFWIGETGSLLIFLYAVRAELPHVSLPLGVRCESTYGAEQCILREGHDQVHQGPWREGNMLVQGVPRWTPTSGSCPPYVKKWED